MSNNYFRFKQFVVNQDKTAMKVGTDGVLLGVLANVNQQQPMHILDIGTGTGLIALMLAQRFSLSEIDAVEIDTDASEQAFSNFQLSPFANRLHIINSDISDYTPKKHYDLIVSNPPYFVNSLKAPNKQRTTARHTDTLSFSALATAVQRLLSSDGKCCIIIPSDVYENVVSIFFQHRLYVQQAVFISHNSTKKAKRVVVSFITEPCTEVDKSELYIEQTAGVYSAEFQKLVEPFYLFSGK